MEVEAAVQETLDWLGKICSMTITMQEGQSHLHMAYTGIVEPWTIHESEFLMMYRAWEPLSLIRRGTEASMNEC